MEDLLIPLRCARWDMYREVMLDLLDFLAGAGRTWAGDLASFTCALITSDRSALRSHSCPIEKLVINSRHLDVGEHAGEDLMPLNDNPSSATCPTLVDVPFGLCA